MYGGLQCSCTGSRLEDYGRVPYAYGRCSLDVAPRLGTATARFSAFLLGCPMSCFNSVFYCSGDCQTRLPLRKLESMSSTNAFQRVTNGTRKWQAGQFTFSSGSNRGMEYFERQLMLVSCDALLEPDQLANALTSTHSTPS